MRVVFLGTPQFAVPSLRRLVASSHQVAAVVTNPDRPRGRGRHAAPSPVKVAATEFGLPVLQPQAADDPALPDQLRALDPELLVVVAFPLLPAALLAVPRRGAVNLHPSLLPRYRGAAPIPWAVIRGETLTGITTFLLSPRMDAGDILLQIPVEIGPEETAGELEARMSHLGADLMAETLDALQAGSVTPRPQSGRATRAPKLGRQDGFLDWSRPAEELRNRVRGTNPVPGAFTLWHGRTLKVHQAQARHDLVAAAAVAGPGRILRLAAPEGLVVATGQGGLRLLEVQPEGGRSMPDVAFLRGHDVADGELLGA